MCNIKAPLKQYIRTNNKDITIRNLIVLFAIKLCAITPEITKLNKRVICTKSENYRFVIISAILIIMLPVINTTNTLYNKITEIMKSHH